MFPALTRKQTSLRTHHRSSQRKDCANGLARLGETICEKPPARQGTWHGQLFPPTHRLSSRQHSLGGEIPEHTQANNAAYLHSSTKQGNEGKECAHNTFASTENGDV